MKYKKNFISELIISIKDFEAYNLFIQNKFSKSIAYILKLLSLLCIIICISLGCILINFQKEMGQQIKEKIMQFKYSNSELMVNSNQYTKLEYNKFINMEIIINTSDNVNVEEYYHHYNSSENSIMVILLKDRYICMNSNTTFTNYYKDLNLYNINEYTQGDIVQLLQGRNMYITTIILVIMIYIFVLIVYCSSVLLDAVLLSILGIITSKILNMKMTLSQVFSVSVHSLTLPIILNVLYFIVNIFTGFTIKYFQTMYIAISYIYLITVMLLLKSEYIAIQRQINKETAEIHNSNKNLEKENNINNGEENNTKGEE